MRTLTPEEAKIFYDRFGSKQDSQAFYEMSALNKLIANSAFQDAQSVFEFGCGTGRFALELLQHRLPPRSVYRGIDISTTMVELASARLAPYASRAAVASASSEPVLPLEDASVDRVVSTYVLDLLPDPVVRQVLSEARRVLRPQGLLCLAGVTHGITPFTRFVMGTWRWLFAINPSWVGGCRPTNLMEHVSPMEWKIHFHTVVAAWGVASEVLVASPLASAGRVSNSSI
jgi:ubiquinone/menaquinone biosynthesis C-methylase UbiE